MSGEGKVIALIAIVALVVGVSMCIGLTRDDSKPRHGAADEDEVAEIDEVATESAPPEPQEEDAEPPEPVAIGERLLEGTVTDPRDEPVAGAEVMIDGYSRLRDITNREGYYQLHSVPNGEETLVVRVTGYADREVKLSMGRPGSRERVDVQLEAGYAVGGMVVDPEGNPVAGAEVACVDRADRGLTVETDRYGRFELPARAVGCDGKASHPDHGDSPRVALQLGPNNLIALALQASIRGTVVDSQGKPVPSFLLVLEEYQPETKGERRGRRSYRQPYANPQGRFVVSDLAPGTYVFSVQTSTGQQVRTKAIRVTSGEQVRDLRVVVP
jgi:protocatechuate 3,4-dioxygenase beta subunit